MLDNNDTFTEWFAKILPEIPVRLEIRHSSRVPGGIRRECSGIEDVLSCYRWRAEWLDIHGLPHKSESWVETQESLFELRAWLAESISQTSCDSQFLKACEAVIRWGGGARSGHNGAKGFVLSKAKDGKLRDYFARAKKAMRLDSAQAIRGIETMNAMLIKIHSLLSDDGLPIYDSRVAGAAGALVELYCRSNGNNEDQGKLPQFPSTDENRRISRLIENCRVSEIIRYRSTGYATKWASAAVALGHLFRDALVLRPDLFDKLEGLSNRMHALEAAMFMIGSDLNSLRPAFAAYSRTPVEWT
ncbi:hypothetical protein [Bradyrhizobium iriomotense]|uniref:hypothetical protein n=1 Tax=Bradyrhizobium iriomotense TaxID=441950 RepID=UPI001B89FF69|nr:hypothetical protein [Bradyrhizobium iriomotense]MBR0783931.1 hypothetical protein [Bradyrhizobium iriomotense]